MTEYLARYDTAAQKAAAQIIASYSTSFSLATKLLAPHIRTDISNLYAMVRIADEIVDGTAHDACCNCTDILNTYEKTILNAPNTRFHTDPVIHAYAITARRCNLNPEHIKAFFNSMRADLKQPGATHAVDLDTYIYGSAEVIGLLCLDIFLSDSTYPSALREELQPGARALGAAFQKINFLRDLAEDTETLGRTYLSRELSEAEKDTLVAEIEADLTVAKKALVKLPDSSRKGVAVALKVFEALTARLNQATVEEIYSRRVRVPAYEKVLIALRA
ncbi:MAG: squalene/phytoene synthase family protein [Corynebacterium sp.]|uniref:phytoene/squalene synthase family protein n=1 Tax=Corynebacterium sp. TaxID=1720 RepID=UPI0026DAD022|nr:squalene/phytoene synthase family protein [Corynebacterium sp.]MDO4762031.1 squalene/phytoene synthase family protein [Corynebacterium sp.]